MLIEHREERKRFCFSQRRTRLLFGIYGNRFNRRTILTFDGQTSG
jgi:hypothetical protein